jgi:hypothetical protein
LFCAVGIVVLVWLLTSSGGNEGEPRSADEALSELPPSFSISRYTTFDEAAAVAGYHIPSTAAYQLRWGFVYLQPSPRPSSAPEVRAIFVGPRETSIYFYVLAPGRWAEGPPGGSIRGETLGGWDGEVLEDEDDYAEFAFQCTEFNAVRLWCIVRAPDLDLRELNEFLATLR